MTKFWKIALSVFIGLDIFVFSYMVLSQLRFMIFGQGQIPGGGSAIDMAIFLLPIFLAWVAGDRLYYFLTYKERREKLTTAPARSAALAAEVAEEESEETTAVGGSVWDDDGWDAHKAAKQKD